ncbi:MULTISPECIES: pirin family protein [unclassified Clostridium]|uniref:pirin family protein n=1 Tax=unclassified Clostridium TaxID=2614128 RepID=UPI0013F0ED82|nr:MULTISPECIES: pirin family protein [unclassified Clostridium]NFG61110.1 pirin family protein [Clostridium botulinum]NFQ08856.1 pirin family protein [Clostridium botulinum]
MLSKIKSNDMGNSNLGWLRSKFHFSFAEYYNPYNMRFGALRVINDDLIKPDTGFDTHPHKDMEIITYVINGELTHEDSMGNKNTITRGHVQYMSAGTGVYHSEFNFREDTLRLLQIWILPDKQGYNPDYGDYRFNWNVRQNKWLHMVSRKDGNAPIKINQDMNVYSLELGKEKEINFTVNEGRQAYLVQIEGTSIINDIELNDRDGMKIIEEDILIQGKETSHILILEMKKE